MRHVIHIGSLFWHQSSIRLARGMRFRQDFILGILVNFVFSCFAPLLQFFIYTKTQGYPGWTFEQLLLFQAMLLFWIGFTGTLFGEARSMVMNDVQQGNFDRLLLLPAKPIVTILTRGFQYKNIGTLFAGTIGLWTVLYRAEFHITGYSFATFALFIVMGSLFYVSLLILYATLVVKFIYVNRLSEIMDTLFTFSNYPAEIYSGFMRSMYLVLFPIAVWVYFPCQALLGRLETHYIYAIAVCLASLFISLFFWNRQLKKYTSAGG